jgi:hypothetical protein
VQIPDHPMDTHDDHQPRRIYHHSELWPGDHLELLFGDRWLPAGYAAQDGYHVVVFEVDRRSIGVAEVQQAIEWGLRPIVH